MVTKSTKKTLESLEQGSYRNTNEIALGGIPFTARDVLVKAPLISRLNCYYVGGTGRGKTQLANDLCSYFEDSSVYAMGRADFEPSELMKTINWELLRKLQTGEQISEGELEKLRNLDKCFFYVDELNRCPPIVQNYFFDFFDGKIVHNGKIQNLGKNGYNIGFASGNLGNNQYTGTSESDRALKDRMHMIVAVDDTLFRPTPFDLGRILMGKKEPRASLPENSKGITKEIIDMNSEFQSRELNPLFPALGVYFAEGLDWLENTSRHSKIAIPNWYHSNVDGVRQDTDESMIYPLSPRGVLSAQALASALQFIAEAKDIKVESSVDLYLDALKLTVPFSGVLHPIRVDMQHNGDVYSAFDEAIEFSREQIKSKKDALEIAVTLAEMGKKDKDCLKEIAPEKGRWTPVKSFISDYADYRKENPSEDGVKLREVIEKSHEVK